MTRRSFVANASLSRTRYRYANAITFCNGDLAQSAVLGSPQEEQLCKTDPDTKLAAYRGRGLKPPKFVNDRISSLLGHIHRP
jgi:hypothetical protein